MLIVYVIRRMKKTSFLYRKLNGLKKLALKLKILLFLLALSISYGANTNTKSHIKYHVVRNNAVIGTIQISCHNKDDLTTYSLESHIVAKYILKFNISGKETSIFKDGFLVYSSVFRTLNNKVKTDHTIVYKNGQYQLRLLEDLKRLEVYKIQKNLVTLYFNEPKEVKEIFCDNLKQMVRIQPLGHGRYKVFFINVIFDIDFMHIILCFNRKMWRNCPPA